MKKYFLFLVITSLVYSCAQPYQLTHEDFETELKRDVPIGTLSAYIFEDNRPEKEQLNKSYGNAFKSYFPIGDYSPELDVYLTTIIEDEIKKSNLFEIKDEDSEYQLLGSFNSLKLENKANGLYIAGYVAIMALPVLELVAIASGGFLGLIPTLVLAGGGSAMVLSSKVNSHSVIEFEYVLSKNNTEILSNTIKVNIDDRFGVSKVKPENLAVFFDEAVTIAIRDMIKQINNEIK